MLRAAFVASTLMAGVISQPPTPAPRVVPQQPQQQSTKQADTLKTGNPISGPVTTTTSPTGPETPANRQSQPATRERDESSRSWSDWTIAFFTCVLAVVSFFQWRVLREHARTFGGLLHAMEQGLVETKKAADAATKNADTAETALRVTQRAFVVLGEIMVKNFTVGSVPEFVWQVSNVGTTPATTTQTIVGTFPAIPLPPLPNYEAAGAAPRPNIVIGPRMPVHLPIKIGGVLTQERYELLRASEFGIQFCAKVVYLDVFGVEHVERSAVGINLSTGAQFVPDNPAYFESS